jgi:hypothetical protein
MYIYGNLERCTNFFGFLLYFSSVSMRVRISVKLLGWGVLYCDLCWSSFERRQPNTGTSMQQHTDAKENPYGTQTGSLMASCGLDDRVSETDECKHTSIALGHRAHVQGELWRRWLWDPTSLMPDVFVRGVNRPEWQANRSFPFGVEAPTMCLHRLMHRPSHNITRAFNGTNMLTYL